MDTWQPLPAAKQGSIPFDVLSERAKVVMAEYGISDRNDIAFVASVAWMLGIELGVKFEPITAGDNA